MTVRTVGHGRGGGSSSAVGDGPRDRERLGDASSVGRLDPRARVFLWALEAIGWPSMAERTPAEARRDLRLLASMTGGWQPVARARDAIARDGDRRVRVRVYQPLGGSRPRPLLVWFHGGGFVVGDLSTADGVCRALANEAGAVVVSVDYRRAPEHPVPAPQEDAIAATAWAMRHARALGGDPARVAVGGESAGGSLAAVVAQHCRDHGPQPVALQLLVYPATDFTLSCADRDPALARLLTWETIDWFAALALPEACRSDPRVSPAFAADLSGLPPAVVVTAEVDPFRADGRLYAQRLCEAGGEVTTRDCKGQLHGFLTMDLVFPAARRARRALAQRIATTPPIAAATSARSTQPIEWEDGLVHCGRRLREVGERQPVLLGAQMCATVMQTRMRQLSRLGSSARDRFWTGRLDAAMKTRGSDAA
jgi:acetyl esterase